MPSRDASQPPERALPGSRWRRSGKGPAPRGAPGRVPAAQAQARKALTLSGGFVAASLSAWAVPTELGRWLPLHLFLAGAVVLAISGATILFTVTWAAAPAPPTGTTTTQRWLVAVGAAGVGLGRELRTPDLVLALAAAAFTAGLLLLGVVLARTARHAVERRFDVPVAWYLAAIASGVVAAVLGLIMAIDAIELGPRGAHVALNLLGLVGLVIGGTVPTFVATVGRSRMSRRATPRRHGLLLAWQVLSLTAIATGAVTETSSLTSAGLVAHAAGVAGLLTQLPTPSLSRFGWAGPRLVGIWAGLGWWVVALVGASTSSRHGAPLSGDWLVVLVVGAYAQILWASLSYLVPMLRGGGHRMLTRGFATTRSWTGFALANAAAVAAAIGSARALGVAATAWALDALWRFGSVARRRDVTGAEPTPGPTPPG